MPIPLEGGDHAQPIIHNILLKERTMHSTRIHNTPLEGGDQAQLTYTLIHRYPSTRHSALICPYLSKEATMHSPSYTTYFLRRRPCTAHKYTHTLIPLEEEEGIQSPLNTAYFSRRGPCTAHEYTRTLTHHSSREACKAHHE
jgi:hypothetical protein